jgi:hypothetical protein
MPLRPSSLADQLFSTIRSGDEDDDTDNLEPSNDKDTPNE